MSQGQGCLSHLLGGKKVVSVPLRVFSLERSTAGTFTVPFTVLSLKNITGDNVLLELVPLRGKKHFKPRPQNRILVPLRGPFQNFG